MKSLLLLCLSVALLGATCLDTAAQSACSVNVHVDGFRNQKGALAVTVFGSPNGWPEDNDKAIVHQSFEIGPDGATAQFSLPAGRYSIAVLHDENDNHKLDRNLLGIPKEGFGFSNNPAVGLSAPQFAAAAVQVSCPSTNLSIHLTYK